MKALVSSFHQALSLSKPPPWNPKPRILRPITMQNLTNSSKKPKSQTEVNPKGFATSPAKESGKKIGNGDSDEISEAVFNRIIRRVLAFVGIPMAIGVAILKILDAIKEKNVWEFPMWLPFLTTFLTFGASTMGIAYGALSASLDEERKGTLFGWEEVQKNWVEMWNEGEEETDR